MKFKSLKVNYVGRYGANSILVCMLIVFFIFDPSLSMLFQKLKNNIADYWQVLLILLMPIISIQFLGFFLSQPKTKLLSVLDSKVIFNLFSGKTIELNYSDISCLNYTQDIFKNFQFTLKNGEVKVVCATVKNQQQAFELIQQKIRESQT